MELIQTSSVGCKISTGTSNLQRKEFMGTFHQFPTHSVADTSCLPNIVWKQKMRSFHHSSCGRKTSRFAVPEWLTLKCYRGTWALVQMVWVMLCWTKTYGKLLCKIRRPVEQKEDDTNLTCCINIPNNTFWAIVLERKWAHTEKESKNLWTIGRTHDIRKRSTLLYHLSYKAKWELILRNKDGNLGKMNT